VQEVKELHLEDMDVIVEPGIGWMELNEYLKPHGLFFPLDPGNALCMVKHLVE
jgi:D-lactate dehydrogenase (cytochrome)